MTRSLDNKLSENETSRLIYIQISTDTEVHLDMVRVVSGG